MKILIVDDDPLAGDLAAAVLEDAGHVCRLAEDAGAALEALSADPGLELVVSDMNMPLLSGLDLFQELRGQGLERPFILLSGDDPEPLRAQAPGVAAVLMKDATLEELLPAAVARIVARPTD
jgi:CheY-like chemotaxis protein